MAPQKHIRRRPGNPQFERKSAQLCRQVERRLALAFAELEDQDLAELLLIDVRASPDGSRLLLELQRPRLGPGAPRSSLDDFELLDRLGKVRSFLRQEVAAAIHRRRTPELDFRLIGEIETPAPS